MNTLKSIFTLKHIYLTAVLLLLAFISYQIYTINATEKQSVQFCDGEAFAILMDTLTEEGVFEPDNYIPLDSDMATESLERHKLYYDLAFDICLHSWGYTG